MANPIPPQFRDAAKRKLAKSGGDVIAKDKQQHSLAMRKQDATKKEKYPTGTKIGTALRIYR